MNIFYVYVHRKLTDGQIFYVGKGKGNRDKSRSGRSNHWRNIVAKHGYYIERVIENLDEVDAYNHEVRLISELRADGENICNIADGGNGGLSGHSLSEEHKEKLRKAKIGKKQMPEHAKKSASAKLGKKQPRSAVDFVSGLKSKKIINSSGRIFNSASEAYRVMSKETGINSSQGNISACARGERKSAYGLNWSYNINIVPKKPKDNPLSKKISNSDGMTFESAGDAILYLKSVGVNAKRQCISACARGEQKSAYGKEWWYE